LLAWPTVPYGHPDHLPLVMTRSLLQNGATGILDRTLVQPKRVRSASSGAWHQTREGMFYLGGQPREGQSLDEVASLLDRALEDLRQGDFSGDDLASVVLQSRISDKQARESNARRVTTLTAAVQYDVTLDDVLRFSDRLALVTRDDVLRVVQDYLGADRVHLRKTTGQPDLPSIRAPELPPVQLNTDVHSAFYEEIVDAAVDGVAPQTLVEDRDYTVVDTRAGRVYATPNPYSDLFSVTWRWERGSGTDPGLCEAWRLFDASGAGDDDLAAFERTRYSRGIRISTSCSRYGSSLTVSGEEARFEEALALVALRFRSPVVDEGKLTRIVEDVIRNRTDAKTTSSTQSSALASYALLGTDSPFLASVQSDDALRALTETGLQEQLLALWNQQCTMFYVGTRDSADVAATLAPADRTFAPLTKRPRIRVRRRGEPEVLLLDVDAVQSSVRLYVPGDRFDRTAQTQHRWLAEILGGSAGLLFQEVRESRGLAYSASGGYRSPSEPGDDGYLYAVLATQADKTASATALVTDLLRPPSPDPARYERARAAAIESIRTERLTFRQVGPRVASWHRQGIVTDPRADRIAELEALAPKDLGPWFARLQEQPFTLAIAGDLDRID
ncbi:MAG: insulinase family protein, partial [Myxococcota bacterium]